MYIKHVSDGVRFILRRNNRSHYNCQGVSLTRHNVLRATLGRVRFNGLLFDFINMYLEKQKHQHW